MAVDVPTAAQRQAREFAERSLQRLAAHLEKLRQAKVEPVIIGGWAVTAHGSPLGSRDIDALILQGQLRAAGDALGNTDFVARHLEGDTLFDYDFYDSTNTSRLDLPYKFHYRAVLDRHVIRKTLSFGQGSVTLRVPDATALFFLKVKAFADRSYCYHLSTHAEDLRHLDDDVKEFIRHETATYWAAKAAKDMEDIAFLSTQGIARRRLAALLEASGLRKYAIREWTRRMPELYEVADRIRADAGLEPGFAKARYDAVLDVLS